MHYIIRRAHTNNKSWKIEMNTPIAHIAKDTSAKKNTRKNGFIIRCRIRFSHILVEQ